MSDLSAFLLARIAEDEEWARLCAETFPPPWEVADRGWRVRIYSEEVPDVGDHAEPGWMRAPCVMEVEPQQNHDDPLWLSERVEHVRRHDPARVLAECEAKRRIVEHHAPLGDEFVLCNICTEVGPDAQMWPCFTLRALVAVYADHEDFKEEWR